MLTSVPELVTMEAGSVMVVSAFFLRHHSAGISGTVWGQQVFLDACSFLSYRADSYLKKKKKIQPQTLQFYPLHY